LSAAESAELAQLLVRHPNVDAQAFERVVAAIHVAELGRLEPMPAHLRSAVLARAPAGVSQLAAARPVTPRRRAGVWPWLAAAAALVAAVLGWWSREHISPALGAERAALVAAGARQIDWKATDDPAATGAAGDVVWDPHTQRGFMRIVGLAANEPTRLQYQLWIFDRLRDQRYPVDGGVFDIPAGGGEVIVPIRARLSVGDATLFAVTVEAPGGVVVSSREHIVLLAQAG
jgi:hypothetical protein